MKTASTLIGDFFVWARDHVARGLVAVGVTPNMLTVTGLLIACTAAVLMGRGQWLAAGFVLMGAGACDMLDGAVARIGAKKTPFGGILDSTCDRIGDIALLAGLGYYYLLRPIAAGEPPNLTYALLALLGIVNATLISYIRARVRHENIDCDIGFWKRGERYAGTVIAVFAANPAMLLWELGAWTGLTALYRLVYSYQVIAGRLVPNAQRRLVSRVVFFDEPRGSLAYDVHTGLAIALLIFARIPETDVVRALVERLGGG